MVKVILSRVGETCFEESQTLTISVPEDALNKHLHLLTRLMVVKVYNTFLTRDSLQLTKGGQYAFTMDCGFWYDVGMWWGQIFNVATGSIQNSTCTHSQNAIPLAWGGHFTLYANYVSQELVAYYVSLYHIS